MLGLRASIAQRVCSEHRVMPPQEWRSSACRGSTRRRRQRRTYTHAVIRRTRSCGGQPLASLQIPSNRGTQKKTIEISGNSKKSAKFSAANSAVFTGENARQFENLSSGSATHSRAGTGESSNFEKSVETISDGSFVRLVVCLSVCLSLSVCRD